MAGLPFDQRTHRLPRPQRKGQLQLVWTSIRDQPLDPGAFSHLATKRRLTPITFAASSRVMPPLTMATARRLNSACTAGSSFRKSRSSGMQTSIIDSTNRILHQMWIKKRFLPIGIFAPIVCSWRVN